MNEGESGLKAMSGSFFSTGGAKSKQSSILIRIVGRDKSKTMDCKPEYRDYNEKQRSGMMRG